MKRISYRDVHNGEIQHYNTVDILDFGKNQGHTIGHLIVNKPDYIDWMLSTQDGFGLDYYATMCKFDNETKYAYPNGKGAVRRTRRRRRRKGVGREGLRRRTGPTIKI